MTKLEKQLYKENINARQQRVYVTINGKRIVLTGNGITIERKLRKYFESGATITNMIKYRHSGRYTVAKVYGGTK